LELPRPKGALVPKLQLGNALVWRNLHFANLALTTAISKQSFRDTGIPKLELGNEGQETYVGTLSLRMTAGGKVN
jgi:hypothetical protein